MNPTLAAAASSTRSPGRTRRASQPATRAAPSSSSAWVTASPSTVTATLVGAAAADAAASAGIVSPLSPAANDATSGIPGRCSRQPARLQSR